MTPISITKSTVNRVKGRFMQPRVSLFEEESLFMDRKFEVGIWWATAEAVRPSSYGWIGQRERQGALSMNQVSKIMFV